MAGLLRHRLASYALVAILSVGATGALSPFEAVASEERREAVGKSSAIDLERPAPTSRWVAATGDATSFSSQSWLAATYQRLLSLRAAISSAFSHAWRWADHKPSNTCR
jgi:hypothetical protein